ncbi:unnamed protein product [Penicillium olsonii]|nr:unnamed protein product [Penicillium olsonii]
MKFFSQLIESIAPFQFIFTTTHDNPSIESFATPEYPRNSVPTSADFHPQKTHDYTKQSADISAHSPQRATSLSEAYAHTNHHTVTPQPVDKQPAPIGFIYKPSCESTGTYLNPRTPPATPQKSVKLCRQIICGSKPTT